MALDIISMALYLVSLFCFIYVVVKMFQNGNVVLGIVCLVFCGVGQLIAFAFGWIRSSQWNIKGLMLIWTVAIIAAFTLNLVHTPEWLEPSIQKIQSQFK